jgi:hypothetical protein
MRMNKKMLKELIKECVIEILCDGIKSDKLNEAKSQLQESRKIVNKKTPITQVQNQANSVNSNNDYIKIAAGGNSLLESVMADTAKTSLIEQIQNEIPNQSHSLTTQVPEQNFVENDNYNSYWAQLAFAPSTKKE